MYINNVNGMDKPCRQAWTYTFSRLLVLRDEKDVEVSVLSALDRPLLTATGR